MAVKIFTKMSYNINGVASPSIIYASAWVDELNEINSDERKISSFLGTQSFPFFNMLQMYSPLQPDVRTSNLPIDETWEESLTRLGFVENENHPLDSYVPIIGFIGEDEVTEKLAFIMSNLAYDTAHSGNDIEPAKAFFYIHKLTTDEIDSFLDDHPAIDEVNASVTDLYDLLLPCIATKNDVLEAGGYRQATNNGDAIVLYADSITYF